jgi:1-acyl-sn-glycerol-3-phosphate acyltransferase
VIAAAARRGLRFRTVPLVSLPFLARVATGLYYRLTLAGAAVPRRGAVLLVANHPNSLLDPGLVMAAAGRPVRFLAKAPLFSDPKTAWLVRLADAIPVYRRRDDPAQMDRNVDAFRAVFDALGGGAAVAIFPEGLSHSEPSLAPLRTGAARIALGAAARTGAAFPIVPVGLTFARKDEFRSAALVLVGTPVAWDDLAPCGDGHADAVRTLTDRIAAALRSVTLNLEQWEDRPLVECAVRIWEAEHRAVPDRAERLARLEVSTQVLAWLRARGDGEAAALVADVRAHLRRMERLRLHPADLVADVGASRGIWWGVRRAHLMGPLALALAAAGFLLFVVPYQVTGRLVASRRLEVDQVSTWKLLLGIAVYAGWLVLLAAAGAAIVGPVGAAAALLGVPAVGMLGLLVRERWRGAWSDARRFFLLRSRRDLLDSLRAAQRDLGARLQRAHDEYTPQGAPA